MIFAEAIGVFRTNSKLAKFAEIGRGRKQGDSDNTLVLSFSDLAERGEKAT
jgi:hypothetical protein